MLSEEEKIKIELTESYRHEIQDKLSKPVKSRNQVLAVFNSPIVIWLLSTVIVGSISYLYTERQNEYAENQIKTENIRRLDDEITARLDECDRVTWRIDLANDSTLAKKIPERVFGIPEKGRVIYEEYSNRTLRSLMYELAGLLKDDHDAQLQVELAIEYVGEYHQLFTN